jgi:predicted transcriptional regulator
METIRSAVPSDVPAVQGGVALQGGVAVRDGVVVPPQWFDPRRAVHEDDIMCLVCGKCFRQLTNTHLRSHDLTTASYKIRFGYNRRRPLMSLALRQMYTARAIQTSLASRIRCRPIVSNPELRKRGGQRPIALEEVLARRDAQLRRRENLRAAAAQHRAHVGAGAAKRGRRSSRGRLTAISRADARPATRRSSTGR